MRGVQKRKSSSTASKTNVMMSLTWMCGVFETVLIPCTLYAIGWLQIALFCLSVFVVIFYCGMYAFFAFKQPDRLQSEEYILAQAELTLLGEKELSLSGGKAKVVTVPNTAIIVSTEE